MAEIVLSRLRYRSPIVQILIMSFVCFACPGIFNAIMGIGNDGKTTKKDYNNAHTATYAALAVFSLLGGGIVNIFGLRIPIFFCGLMYALNTGAHIYYNTAETNTTAFLIVSAVLMGVGGGILWAGQGMVMVSYPRDNERGSFIAIFWVIFNIGGMLGAIILFSLTFTPTGNIDYVSNASYIVLTCIQVLGAVSALTLVSPKHIMRDDGALVTTSDDTSSITEATETARLFSNRWLLLLTPMFFTSNFFYTYQFSPFNNTLFTMHTRGFNNIFYWGAQSLMAIVASFFLDQKGWSRRRRALIATITIAVAFNAVWIGALMSEMFDRDPDYKPESGGYYDIRASNGAMVGTIFLYIFFGFCDALWQILAYWFIGTMTSDPHITARYVAYYKFVQSLGAVVAWQLDANDVSSLAQLIICWALVNVSLPLMFYVGAVTKELMYDSIPPSLMSSHSTDDLESFHELGPQSSLREKSNPELVNENTPLKG
ncbi:hypothetical protein H4219_000647 [Mycoemilia scoparia]|uniref:Uncharacterized protein n=1 Tax=Mycoemilia scoparia TaxID=417184 RepID=A0A9W8DWZ6_9FUNG|nr:hypothetical protein H4219_000647 [Mycoemilia scoparia]